MPSYEELDITPMINANATLTRLGAARSCRPKFWKR